MRNKVKPGSVIWDISSSLGSMPILCTLTLNQGTRRVLPEAMRMYVSACL